MGGELFFSCGELSGDRNAAFLLKALKTRDQTLTFSAIGARGLREAGAEVVFDSSRWGSVGWFESAAKFFTVFPKGLQAKSFLSRRRPAAFIPVDYRVFNMSLARKAKSLGVPVVYYYAPVSWFGSGTKRFAKMAECVDLALLTLPVSLERYRAAGPPHEFIGNPLIDMAKPELSREDGLKFFGLEEGRPVIGLMPGSRTAEVARVLPELLDAADRLAGRFPGAQFLLFEADPFLSPLLRSKMGPDSPVRVARKKTYDFMNACDLLLLCSGTVTHEAMVMKKPMVVAYKVSAATAALARAMADIRFAALPNILADRAIVPECIQEDCRGETIADEAARILESGERRARMIDDLCEQREKLGPPGAAGRAADRILEVLDKRSAPKG